MNWQYDGYGRWQAHSKKLQGYVEIVVTREGLFKLFYGADVATALTFGNASAYVSLKEETMQRPPVSGTAKLTTRFDQKFLTINGKDYLVQHHPRPNPHCASLAFRLTKEDGTQYDVHIDANGDHCTCPDFIFAREHRDRKGCKHVAGLRAVGLLPGEMP